MFTPIEWIIFIAAAIGCAVGIHGLATGYITI
jgi:arginine:ornithine antiporter/lysine permease